MSSPAPSSSARDLFRLHLLADHFPALHGLRALAIVSVLQVHVSITFLFLGFLKEQDQLFLRSTNVWFGMDLFFVLSGFLIGTLLLPAREGRGQQRILRFYVRRAFRIVPLYYVVLTALALMLPLQPYQRVTLVYEYAYLTNYGPFLLPPVMAWAWSLCVEEHFYLAVPILALVLAKLPRPAWRKGALVGLWVFGLAVRWAVFASRPFWTANEMTFNIYTKTHTRFDVLVAGVLLAYVQRDDGPRIREILKRPGPRVALAVVPIVCVVALVGPLARRQDLATVFAWGTVTSIMYFALVLLLLNTSGLLPRFLSARSFLRFATLGYGVYLVHPPVLAHAVAPVAAVMLSSWHWPIELVWVASVAMLVVASAAVAYALHLCVEKPALWLRDRVAR